MAKLLDGASEFAISYLDDIICYSSDFTSHLTHLQDLFDRIRKTGMKLQKSKYSFLHDEVKYLGHVITNDGILPDPNKIKVIKELTPPKSVKGVRSLIGMTSYYRPYIPDYAKIAYPLARLTQKHVPFEWNDDKQKGFEQLKEALINPPVLAIPQLDKEFKLYTDASDISIGAVLVQVGEDGGDKPVHYLSH